jgi:NTE family protein
MSRLASAALAAALATAMSAASATQAAECARAPIGDRPKIGLVLGGGGARGAAHIGVIRLLEELHVPIDYVAGTSMGALVGGFYATGMNAEQLEATVMAIDFDTLFKDATARQDKPYLRKLDDNLGLFGPKVGIGPNSELLSTGAIQGQKISFLFERLTTERVRDDDFDNLPIPYRAVATNIIDGNAVVLGSGNLAVAMRASMSVPGAFSPVELGQYMLVDGGIADNVPIDVVRNMGADIVIAVDVGTPLQPRESLRSFVSVTAQLSGLLVVRNSQAQIATLTDRDVLISPTLGADITSASFDKAAEAIPIGYQGANAKRAALEPLSIGAVAYAEQRTFIEACVSPLPPVQFVKLNNRSRFQDAVILDRLHVPLGEPLNKDNLDRDIQQIYGLGFLAIVRYEVVEENGATGVVIHVTQDPRGTRFLEWGVDIFSGPDGTDANLRLAVLDTHLDDLGSEGRVLVQLGETPAFLAEVYKAVSPPLQLYLRPKVFWERLDLSTFDDNGNALNTYQVSQVGGQFDVIRELGDSAALSVGVRRFSGHASVQVGEPSVQSYSYNGAEYVANAALDSWDDRYFPSSGTLANLTYLKSATALGADEPYEQILALLVTAWSTGRHTLFGGFRYQTTLDNNAPIYAEFRGGGLFNLSGLQPNEVNGQNFGVLLSSYRYDLSGEGGLFPAFVGVSAEFGNAGENHQDPFSDGIMNGSIYFANRSPIGPLYWGVGFAEGGEQLYFLRIGNVFGRSTIGR